jgi:YVTN family beta-propeller protein
VPLGHTSYANNLTGGGKLLAAFLSNGIGFTESAAAAGLAVTPDGNALVVANIYNESISVVSLVSYTVLWEYDLRPYNTIPGLSGFAGGESPFGVAISGNSTTGYTAWVSSIRDRQVLAVPLAQTPPAPGSVTYIPVPGTPNSLVLNASQSRLYVAQDNVDQVGVIDTAAKQLIGSIPTIPVPGVLNLGQKYTGGAPNNLALSPDGKSLFVTNGGANAVSVIDLTLPNPVSVALLPTAWYPHSVSVSNDGQTLYVVNGKSDPGPNPGNVYNKSLADENVNPAANEYIEQLEKGGLQTIPLPGASDYAALTNQVADNNGYTARQKGRDVMAALHAKIHHVIYIIKENRTFDQILGDLRNGANGDAKLAEFGRPITPSLHRLADQFVTLDNFYCAGEVSGDGWPWSTEARESDFGVTTIPMNYANRGSSNDSEGLNRLVNVALPTAGREAAYPTVSFAGGNLYDVLSSTFPGGTANLLPGTANDFATDGPAGTPPQQGYLWDSALRGGLSVRDYGFLIDIVRYNIPVAVGGIPLIENPFATNTQVAWSSNPTLAPYTDIYYRGFDNSFPDNWRFEEWNREFQQYVTNNNLPNLSLVRLMHDHTGNYCAKPYTEAGCPAADLVTPERQEADNDYAVGRLIETVAASPYANDTLIFILEDDAQDGPDHVDAHRSPAYVVGPYVKRHRVISTHYDTVNMVRTIEDVLGIDHLNLNDTYQAPMADLFDVNAPPSWSYTALPSTVLKKTGLVPQGVAYAPGPDVVPTHDQDYWAQKTKGFDWSKEDRIPADKYNRILWEGLKGDEPYPGTRGGE